MLSQETRNKLRMVKAASAGLVGINAVAQGLGTAAAAGALTMAGMGAAHLVDAATKSRDFRKMLNDPYNEDLSEMYRHNPKKFITAFNSLRDISPEFSKNPMVAGLYMRKVVSMGDRDPALAASPLLEAMQHQSKNPSMLQEVARAGGEAAGAALMDARQERRLREDFRQRKELENMRHQLGIQADLGRHARATVLETHKQMLRDISAHGMRRVDKFGNPLDRTVADVYDETMSSPHVSVADKARSAFNASTRPYMRHQTMGLSGMGALDRDAPMVQTFAPHTPNWKTPFSGHAAGGALPCWKSTPCTKRSHWATVEHAT